MRWKPSPSMVVSLIALSVALAGGATAASNLITGAQIKNGTITGADIKPGSITSAHIKNGSVTTADLRNGTIALADVSLPARRALSKPGPRGPQGIQGPPGMQGVPGASGPISSAKLDVVTGPDVVAYPGDVVSADASCPAGQRATGGGFFSSITHTGASIPGWDRWTAIVNNEHSIPVTINAYVICLAA